MLARCTMRGHELAVWVQVWVIGRVGVDNSKRPQQSASHSVRSLQAVAGIIGFPHHGDAGRHYGSARSIGTPVKNFIRTTIHNTISSDTLLRIWTQQHLRQLANRTGTMWEVLKTAQLTDAAVTAATATSIRLM